MESGSSSDCGDGGSSQETVAEAGVKFTLVSPTISENIGFKDNCLIWFLPLTSLTDLTELLQVQYPLALTEKSGLG